MPDITLHSRDGHELLAHRVDPLGSARGAVVVVQEIFGVNAHIRAVTARFAGHGYVAIAPALFDRIERCVELGYDPPGFTKGRELVGKLTTEQILADLQAAIDEVASTGLAVATVGYCWGGAVTWLAAHHGLGLSAAISYYGSRIINYVEQGPTIPLQMHVGAKDASFPIDKVREVGHRYPQIELHEYDAGHGFDCDHRADFDSTASAHAMARTFTFMREHGLG